MKIDIGRKYDGCFIFSDRNINTMAELLMFSLIRNIYQISEKKTFFPTTINLTCFVETLYFLFS